MLKELHEEIEKMQSSIDKWTELKHFAEAKTLGEMRFNLVAQAKLYEESCNRMICTSCGHTDMAHEFGISASVQECEHCGNHVKIVVTCPNCSKESVIYQDRQYE